MYSNDFEDLIEHAYWVFDARRNGYPPYKSDTAYSERDDFKMALREALSKMKAEHEIPSHVSPP